MLANLRAIWRPEMYHGNGKTKDFFEGWYFKSEVDTCTAQRSAQGMSEAKGLCENWRKTRHFWDASLRSA